MLRHKRKQYDSIWLAPAIWVVIYILFMIFLLVNCAGAKQIQPDPKRVHQIQIALDEHGYILPKHATWVQTQAILKKIALDHDWQTHRIPDARVLILLGLGNEHSNPEVTDEGRNYLDGGKKND